MSQGPVNYIEKGEGLHAAVTATGHFLREEDGIWIGGGPNGPLYVQGIIDSYVAPSSLRRISKPSFLQRIPPQKLGRLMALAETDPIMLGFKLVLFDPTLTEVDLDSPYLVGAMDYLISEYPDDVTVQDKTNWLA